MLLEQIANPAFLVQDLVAVGRAISMCYPELGTVDASFSKDVPAAGKFRLDRFGNSGIGIRFSPSLMGLPSGHMATIFSRCLSCLKLVASFSRGGHTTRGSTYFDTGDWGSGVGLSFCENNNTGFLIPDTSFLVTDGYSDLRQKYAENDVTWFDRKPLAFWRGSSTGVSAGEFMDLPRIRLCQVGATAPELVDAGITAIVQTIRESDIAHLRDKGITRLFVPPEEFNRYRYNIDIDGNTNSWPGLFFKLLTGSPVLKVESPNRFRQWYYDRLVPWQNFVPIQSDLSDLLSVIQFLIDHDDIAREIGLAGKALADAMTIDRELDWSHGRIKAAFRDHRFHRRPGLN